jgi:hypothetical protein
MGLVERVLGSASRILVLRVLLEQEEVLTGRGLWARVRELPGAPRSLSAVQAVLLDLVKAGVVRRERVVGSPALLYQVEREHPFVQRFIAPMLALDGADGAQRRPADEELRIWLAGDAEGMGLYSATLQAPDSTPGALAIHYMLQSGVADVERTERWLRTTLEMVAAARGREARLERFGYQDIGARSAEAAFRDAVITRGAHLAGMKIGALVGSSSY